MKKYIFIASIIFLALFCFATSAFCDQGISSRPAQKSKLEKSLNISQEKAPLKEAPQADAPDWLKRTNFAFEVDSNNRPKYFLETIQPLFGSQNKETVFFNQSRISEKSGRPTYNIGLGLRKIFPKIGLLGINTFYDYQDWHKHSRGGLGVDLVTDRGIEARVNSYLRISNERLIKEDSVNYYYEKVANGLDGELGLPLPYLPFLKIYGGGYWYNFEHFKNKYGWQGRLEFTPVKFSRLNLEVYDDTKTKNVNYRLEGAVTLAFTSFSLSDIIKDIKGSRQEAYPKVDLENKVLDRVVRDFDITVITTIKSKSTGLTVEGGKSG